MIRNTFFESPGFTSMGEAQQRELRRTLKKVAQFEERTGQMLEDGFTREQYVNLFNSMSIRHTNSFFQFKSLLSRYVQYLIADGVLAAEQFDVLDSLSIDDLSKVYYYKNVNMLYEAVKDTIESAECYDPSSFNPPAVAIFLSWYGLTRDEIADYRKENVLDDGIIVKGEKIIPPSSVLNFFTSLRDAKGYYQKARGVIFHKYPHSDYLIRTRFKDHVKSIDVANLVVRINQVMDGDYALELNMIRQSGIFFRAYQLECDNVTLDLDDPAFASKVFCEDFTGTTKKYKVAHMGRVRDYKLYKRLFY